MVHVSSVYDLCSQLLEEGHHCQTRPLRALPVFA